MYIPMPEARINNASTPDFNKLRDYLEEKYLFYNRREFITDDPVSVPHRFLKKEDIEIAGFLTATLAWGNRVSIIRSAAELMKRMDNTPFRFITDSADSDLKKLGSFVYRTFNGDDCMFFILSLQNIYRRHNGLEDVFGKEIRAGGTIRDSISNFRDVFFEMPHLNRTLKHVSNPARNSSAKRINLFLRWMVRNDDRGVDFGIWKSIRPSQLFCPLDLHTGNQSRKLGLLKRKQNDWKAVEELTENLRKLDPADPVKYDFALFGSGIYESTRKYYLSPFRKVNLNHIDT